MLLIKIFIDSKVPKLKHRLEAKPVKSNFIIKLSRIDLMPVTSGQTLGVFPSYSLTQRKAGFQPLPPAGKPCIFTMHLDPSETQNRGGSTAGKQVAETEGTSFPSFSFVFSHCGVLVFKANL